MIALTKLAAMNDQVSLAKVSEVTRISRRYLEQVAIPLKNAGLIRGVSGKGGGYLLTRSPEDINVGEVIEAVIGPINIVDCVRRPDACLITDICSCRHVYVLLNDSILSALKSFTIADLSQIGEKESDCISALTTELDGDEKAEYFPGGSPCTSE